MSFKQYDQTNRHVKFKGYTVLWLAIAGRTPAIPIGFEAPAVSESGTPIEYPNGDGTAQGLIITNNKSAVSGSFYIYGNSVTQSRDRYLTATPLISPGDVLDFSLDQDEVTAGDTFNELVNRTWYALDSAQMRSFADRWRVSFSAVAYRLF